MSLDPHISEFASTHILDIILKKTHLKQLLIGLSGMVLSATGFIAISFPVVARSVLPKPKETRLADHLPFLKLLKDRRTLLCRDGTLLQTLRISGRDIMFLSVDERHSLFQVRKNWLDALADTGVTIRIFLSRQQSSVINTPSNDHSLQGELSRRWTETFQSVYHNQQIICLSIAGKSRSALTRLSEAVDLTLQLLNPYQPEILSQPTTPFNEVDKSDERYNNLLTFWASIASPLSRPHPYSDCDDISEMITADILEFPEEKGILKIMRGDEELFMSAIALRRLGDFLEEQMMTDIGALECEFIFLHVINPWSKTSAALKLTQESRMSRVTSFGTGAMEQYDAALQIIEGLDENRSSLHDYAMTLFLIDKKRERLSYLDSEVRKICSSYGAVAIREGAALQASWFSQFPSYSIWPRIYRLFSSNIACNVTFDRPPSGLSKCDWGEGALTWFRTLGGTPYSFQLHVTSNKDAVAHAVCIGPTGSGKTTVISFIAAMALRHPKLRIYIFDRFQGTYIATTALGGTYIDLSTGESSGKSIGLNPCQCEDTPINRAFLRLWLRALSGCEDAQSLDEISQAVQVLFEGGLSMDSRSLSTLYEPCFRPDGPLRRELKKWVDPDFYGPMFNAPRDMLNLADHRLISFDMTHIFKDEFLAQAMISYLMHRIQATISEHNAPAFIFIDETEPMLRNPLFRTYYLTMLQEYRKRGAGVISAFQRPEAIAQTGMGEAIRGQCQTMFLFPNPQARQEDYRDWSLTETEWSYIKGQLPAAKRLKRSVLVKRATGESVVLDTDLSGLGPLIKIFNSGRDNVFQATEFQKKYGEDWVSHYVNNQNY